jgi:Cu-Zn family superoxide dismutase
MITVCTAASFLGCASHSKPPTKVEGKAAATGSSSGIQPSQNKASKSAVNSATVGALIITVAMQSKSKTNTEGSIKLEDRDGGVFVSGKLTGLKPGLHGFHVHENGDCSAADASSAGGHFALPGELHGARGAHNSHLGDLGNIEADRDGISLFRFYVKGLSLKEGVSSIIGRALIVHAKPDDLSSQPAGNSGPRVACGVIRQ